jgi:glutamyl-Q tRNA(Asp) synthetase
MTGSSYVGRFAPSPSGPLHLGSLLAAVASFLDAHSHGGVWLVRMEDIDPPREQAGAADEILTQLQQFGLAWDNDVLFQSQRLDAYAAALMQLANEGLCFRCECTRSALRENGNVYSGQCRHYGVSARDLQYADKDSSSSDAAIRVRVSRETYSLQDRIQGYYSQKLASEVGDFVVRRKDRLFAYQLAVVVDDAYQGITDIVRGIDLLESTPRQLYLQECLGYQTPRYAHLPIIVDAAGDKLSKQSFAPSLQPERAQKQLHQCLDLLGLSPPRTLIDSSVDTILAWGIEHWDIQAVPKLATLKAPQPS